MSSHYEHHEVQSDYLTDVALAYTVMTQVSSCSTLPGSRFDLSTILPMQCRIILAFNAVRTCMQLFVAGWRRDPPASCRRLHATGALDRNQKPKAVPEITNYATKKKIGHLAALKSDQLAGCTHP